MTRTECFQWNPGSWTKVSERPQSSDQPRDTATEPRTGNGFFDLQVALRNVEGDVELLREMAGLFCEDTHERLGTLDDTLRKRDFEGLSSVAHSFKGAVLPFGAERTWRKALDLEETASGGDLFRSEAIKEDLEHDLHGLCHELTIRLALPAQTAA